MFRKLCPTVRAGQDVSGSKLRFRKQLLDWHLASLIYKDVDTFQEQIIVQATDAAF